MNDHDCRAGVIHVFWYSAGDAESKEKQGTVCANCGQRLSGEVPDSLSQHDPFEPYAGFAWRDGEGMELTPEAAREIEERLEHPQAVPTRPPRRVPLAEQDGDGMDDVHRVMRTWDEAGEQAERHS